MKSKIKNIIFDLGNVIIDIDPQKTSRALKSLLNVDYDLFEDRPKKVFYDFETGKIREEEFVKNLIQWAGDKQVKSEAIIDAWNAMLLDIPLKRLEMMRALSDNYKIFILSNTNATHIQWVRSFLRRHYGDDQWTQWGVSQAYYSHELDSRKPEEICYTRTLDDAGIIAEETLFVDDHPINVESALRLGIQAVVHPAQAEICDEINRYLS